jgi:signal transduction histidine kinase
MWQWRAFLNKQSLRRRLIVWFLLIALIPLIWTTIVSYELCKEILMTQAIKHLRALILRQERLINFYVQEKKSDARDFIKDRTTMQAISTLNEVLTRYGLGSPEQQRANQNFESLLTFRMKALNYDSLILMTKTGDIVLSTFPLLAVGENILQSIPFKDLAKIFKKSQETLEMDRTSLVLRPDTNALNTFISVPVLDSDNQLIGVAIVELNTTAMYRFISNFNALGALADLLLVAKVDNKLYATTPLATRKEGKTQEEIDPSSPFGQFITQVLSQKNLVAANIDYFNHKALIVGRRFEHADNWALITKINQDELLAPIERLKYLFWILVTTTAIAVILAASHVARKIASPILALTEKTKILAGGDLSQRIEVTTQDEIGRLGQSFNEMAAQLHDIISHLDYLVAKRTEEYEVQNVKLEQTIKELRQTRDRLIMQEKLASLGALTAGIAHEIKNPLNFINNFSELSLQLQEEIEQHLNSIKSSLPEQEVQELSELLHTLKLNIGKIYEHGKRADSIVYNMLQHSRGMPGEKRLTDIQKLLDEYIALSYHGMRARDSTFNVKIEKHYDSNLPAVEVVPQEVCRVFLNLLNNAYYSVHQKKKQHVIDSSYEPTVRISTERQQENVAIKIWDNGLGIAPEILPKLFTPFFTTKPPGEGTGLGLSLSYNIIVQGHGGTLSANSQLGEFAEFIITLPIKE